MAEEKILISVDVDTEKMQRDLSAAIKSVSDLKAQQKELTKAIIEGNDADGAKAKDLAKVTAELEKNQRQVKSQTAIMQAATAAGLKQNASLDEQRQYLNTLQKAYASLEGEAKAVADAEGGMRDQIKQLTDSIRDQEHALGDDRRNVGNYAESIQKAIPDLGKMKGALEGLSGGSTKASKALDNTDKVMKGMAANPLMTTIFVLVTIGGSLLNMLNKNEEAMKGLQTVTAGVGSAFDKILKPAMLWLEKFLIENLKKALDFVLEAIKTTLGWIDKIAKKFGKDLGLVDAFEAGAAAAQEETEVVKEETAKQVDIRKNAEAELAKEREEMARRRRTDLENELHDLEVKCEKEVSVVGLTEEEKEEIYEYYENLRAKKLQEVADAEEAARQKELADIEAHEVAKMEARQKALEQFGLVDGETPEQSELRLLQEARDQDLINAEEYEIAKTLIAEKYATKREDQIEAEVKKATALYEKSVKGASSATSAALGALSDLLGEYADTSEKAAAAQKAFAMGSILINQAMSIAEGAKGIAAAMAGAAEAAAATGPAAPFTLIAFQAQMVGQVLAVVASVASTIVQAKQLFSQAEKHATGALIPGTYDGKDDVPAWLSHGEVVLNPNQATTALWNMANSPMTGYSYEYMAAAMANAVAQLPAPVVGVKELTDVEDRVSTFNEIASI